MPILRSFSPGNLVSYLSGANVPNPLNTVALQDKGGQVYNALAYGFSANGSTDNTAAYTALLTILQAAGGGTIYFPPGVYRFNGQLTVPLNVAVRLQGAGRSFPIAPEGGTPSGTVLDLRYDGLTPVGGAYNAYPSDYAVVAGLSALWTQGGTTYAVSAGTAYINNAATTTAPTVLPASTSMSVAGLADGDYWADYDGTTLSLNPVNSTWNGTLATTGAIRLDRVTVTTGQVTAVVSARGRVAKIDVRVPGMLEICDLSLACLDTTRTVDEVPLLRTTRTTVKLRNCFFQGSKKASPGSYPIQDAVVLGGPGGTRGWAGGTWGAESVTATGVFGGYGSVIDNCDFNWVRRCIKVGASSNGNAFSNLTIWGGCGAPPGMGAIEFDSPTLASYGNQLSNALIECFYYSYAVLCASLAQGHSFWGINGYDAPYTTVSTPAAKNATTLSLTGRDIRYWVGRPVAIAASDATTAEGATITSGAVTGAIATTLTASASSGNTVQVASSTGLGGQVIVLDGATQEFFTVSRVVDATHIQLDANVITTHASGAAIYVAPWVVPLAAPLQFAHASGVIVSPCVATLVAKSSNSFNNTLVGGMPSPGSFLAVDGASTTGADAPFTSVMAPQGVQIVQNGLNVVASVRTTSPYIIRGAVQGVQKFLVDPTGAITQGTIPAASVTGALSAGQIPGHGATHAPGGSDDLFLLSGTISGARVESIPRLLVTSSQTFNVGAMALAFIKLPKGFTASNIFMVSGSTATSVVTTNFSLAIYTVDANDNLTGLVGYYLTTAAAALSTPSTINGGALTSDGTTAITPTLAAGTRYALGVVWNGTGTASFWANPGPTSAIAGLAPVLARRSGNGVYTNGVPTSGFAISAFGAVANGAFIYLT